ncbi:MAG: YceD family protein [Pseudomonadota bacterium]
MSLGPFPETIDTLKLFARNGILAADLPLTKLERLTDSLNDDSGVVEVNLLFGTDEEKKRSLTGTLDTTVKVLCQRCLQEMELELHCSLNLKVCDDEQELHDLPETEDGIVMEEDGLNILDVIEDELILSLPLVPVHADANCSSFLNALTQAESGTKGRDKNSDAEANLSPFAVLATLKDKPKK